LSSLPGRALSRNFVLPLTDLVPGQATIATSVAARSVNAGSSFSVMLNNAPMLQVPVRPVGTQQYDLFGQQAEVTNASPISQSTASVTVNFTPEMSTVRGGSTGSVFSAAAIWL
jgi:hypothetical protein